MTTVFKIRVSNKNCKKTFEVLEKRRVDEEFCSVRIGLISPHRAEKRFLLIFANQCIAIGEVHIVF